MYPASEGWASHLMHLLLVGLARGLQSRVIRVQVLSDAPINAPVSQLEDYLATNESDCRFESCREYQNGREIWPAPNRVLKTCGTRDGMGIDTSPYRQNLYTRVAELAYALR